MKKIKGKNFTQRELEICNEAIGREMGFDQGEISELKTLVLCMTLEKLELTRKFLIKMEN